MRAHRVHATQTCRKFLIPLTLQYETGRLPFPLSVRRLQDELELLDVVRQILEAEADALPICEISEFESLEVADQDEARSIYLVHPVEVLTCLVVRIVQIPPFALLLYEQHSGPEQVGETPFSESFRDMFLVARN